MTVYKRCKYDSPSTRLTLNSSARSLCRVPSRRNHREQEEGQEKRGRKEGEKGTPARRDFPVGEGGSTKELNVV